MTVKGMPAAVAVKRTVWGEGENHQSDDWVAQETAVALMYNCISHVVMMTTPCDLEDFAIGFSLSEGIVEKASDILDIEISNDDNGIVIAMLIPEKAFKALKNQRRNMTGRTGCGLCGAETLEQAIRPPRRITKQQSFTHTAIQNAIRGYEERQDLMQQTGGVHGAAWCDREGNVQLLREDVGRHNALDKLLGAMAGLKLSAHDGFVLVTSRASYEMVSKVAMADISLMVAVSAPTSLAINMAEQSGVALVGFARDQRHCVYHGAEHLVN